MVIVLLDKHTLNSKGKALNINIVHTLTSDTQLNDYNSQIVYLCLISLNIDIITHSCSLQMMLIFPLSLHAQIVGPPCFRN